MKKLREIFEDINGRVSSKRVIGIAGVVTFLALTVHVVISATNKGEWSTSTSLIEFGIMTFAGLVFGGSAVEFMTKKK